MIYVTLAAKRELLRRKASDAAEGGRLTLRIVPGGAEEPVLVPDIRRIDDEVVEYLGMPVLLVARDVVCGLGEAIIDCRLTPHGARILLRPARALNSAASLGCGGSGNGEAAASETDLAASPRLGAAQSPGSGTPSTADVEAEPRHEQAAGRAARELGATRRARTAPGL